MTNRTQSLPRDFKQTGLCILASLSALALVVTGCGPTIGPAEPVTTEPVTAEPVTAEPVTTEPVTIEWAGPTPADDGNPATLQAKSVISAFNTDHPNITVNYTWHTADYLIYLDQMRVALSAGEGPDVFVVDASVVSRFTDFTEDLRPLAEEKWGADWDQVIFLPAALEGLTFDGKLTSLPIIMNGGGFLMANPGIFERLGIPLPSTYADFVAAAATLRENGVHPIGLFRDGLDQMFAGIAAEVAPGKLTQANAGEIPFTDPDLVEAARVFKRMADDGLFQEGFVGMPYFGPGGVEEQFLTGKVAMLVANSSNLAMMTQEYVEGQAATNPDFEVPTVLRLPDLNGDGEPVPFVAGPGVLFIVNSSSQHKDAAWEFVSWVTSEGAAEFAKWGGLTGAQAVPFGTGVTWATPEAEAAAGKAADAFLSAQFPPRFGTESRFTTAFFPAIEALLTGSKSPEDAMAEVEAAR